MKRAIHFKGIVEDETFPLPYPVVAFEFLSRRCTGAATGTRRRNTADRFYIAAPVIERGMDIGPEGTARDTAANPEIPDKGPAAPGYGG